MAEAPHQKLGEAKETIQHWQFPEQEWQLKALHWPRSSNWYWTDQSMVLPVRFRGTQSHPRISMVRSSTTKDWLEARMDWFITTTNYPTIKRHKESLLPPQNLKHPTTCSSRPILHWLSNHWIHFYPWIRTSSAKWISSSHQSLQWGSISLIAKIHSMGSCHWITSGSSHYTTRSITPPNPIRNQWSKQLRQRTPGQEYHLTIAESLCSKLLLCKEEGWKVAASASLSTP